MAGMAYTRIYRPKSLSEYMGEEVKRKIVNRFSDENNFPQTTLLYGPRGTGKTSLARLITKECLCLNRQDGHSCGVCDMCVSIDDELIDAEFGAETLGVKEVNVGSDGGKADIESIIEEMLEQPTYGYKYHVFILDECHMMTKAAQNALLKVLEEPPKHLCIILATTEPDKLLGTIRDRCQLRIKMKPATVKDITDKLVDICKKENITTSIEALRVIVNSCKRNPRDSIMTLENVAKNFSKQCTVKNVLAEIGAIDTEVYVKYIACANGNDPIADTMAFCNELEQNGTEYKDFLSGLTGFVLNCMKVRFGIGIEDMPTEYASAAKSLFGTYDTPDIDCLLQIIEYANRQISMDENAGQLTVLTTAMRISKVKLLSVGLQHSELEAAMQTELGMRRSAEILKKEDAEVAVQTIDVDASSLLPIFGKGIREITGGIRIDEQNIPVKADGQDEEDMEGLSDDELMNMFG